MYVPTAAVIHVNRNSPVHSGMEDCSDESRIPLAIGAKIITIGIKGAKPRANKGWLHNRPTDPSEKHCSVTIVE